MKKIIISLVIVGIGIAGYIIYVLQSGVELDELSPLGSPFGTPQVVDKLDTMDQGTKEDFMRQVEAAQNQIMEKSEAMPVAARLIAAGDFKPRFHEVEGQALLIEDAGRKILRFENFETDNGPSLHIYLATDLSDTDFIDLGKIKATKGNVNYDINPSVDIKKYNKVLVWCVPFGVLFSYAELSPR